MDVEYDVSGATNAALPKSAECLLSTLCGHLVSAGSIETASTGNDVLAALTA
jgi:hypothetical protein